MITGQPQQALTFYGAVFDWTATRKGSEAYWEWTTSGGVPVGGLITLPDAGEGALWLTTVFVQDLSGTLVKVTENAGTVLHGPVSVRGGRTAVIQAPDGSRLQLRESGASGRTEPWIWLELFSGNPADSAAWLQNVFSLETRNAESGDRIFLLAEGEPVAAVSSGPFEDAPAQWVPVLGVENLGATVFLLLERGGKVLKSSEDSERRVALVSDPQNALLLLQQTRGNTP